MTSIEERMKWFTTLTAAFFSHTGALTHVLSRSQVVSVRLSPEAVIRVGVSYTTRGHYTTHGNRFTGKKMTITTVNTQRGVDVYQDPEAAELPQTQEKLATLKSDLETDTENFFQQKIQPLLKAGTEYTWEVEGKWLTLESPKHRIILLHQATLGELETSSWWWW